MQIHWSTTRKEWEMPGRSLVCVTFSALLAILSCTAVAQELRTPEPEFFGQSDPAPAWAVWAAFYRQLQHQASQSAVLPASLLKSRVGIAEDLTLPIMNLGEDYLRTLQRLQEERRRLGGLAPVRVPQGDLRAHLTPPVERRAPTEADLALQATRTPLPLPRSEAGGGQADVPQQREDPVVAFDASARSALEEHQQQLVGLIGARDYAALERWIASELGEQVRVPRRAYPLSSLDVAR
jgi:hypothetical protein